jgi:hypothetical protein
MMMSAAKAARRMVAQTPLITAPARTAPIRTAPIMHVLLGMVAAGSHDARAGI